MIKRFDIAQPQILKDGDVYSCQTNIHTAIVSHQQYIEDQLLDGMIQAAREAGVNELYLIDRDEVKRAIVEYMERKQLITDKAHLHVKELNVSALVDKNYPMNISRVLAHQFEDVIAPYIIMQAIPDEQARLNHAIRYQGTLRLLIRDTPEKV